MLALLPLSQKIIIEKFYRNNLEWAPPLRVIAIITLFASTLDLMADFLLCGRLAEYIGNFQV